MKNMKTCFLLIFFFLVGIYPVSAKDTIYSINKYSEEKFQYIQSSYQKNGKIDGVVVGGNYLKESIESEDSVFDDYQIMLVKYKKNGELVWNFTYGNTCSDTIDSISYTYDLENHIDGYLIVFPKTYDVFDENRDESFTTTFLKVGLDGKYVSESSFDSFSPFHVNKIIPVFLEDDQFDGYLAILSYEDGHMSSLVRFDREWNVSWIRDTEKSEYEEVSYTDIVYLKDSMDFVGIRTLKESSKKNITQIVQFSSLGEEKQVIESSCLECHLEKADNGFLLYGTTSEVKLKKGEKSYFLIHYLSDFTEDWETIGDVAVDVEKKIRLFPSFQDNQLKEYFLFYGNDTDHSFEVVQFDLFGAFQKKVKKIMNDYYDIEDFFVHNEVIYFVGQINCPDDDNCEFDMNSLFLISDEDKVIEVEDNDSKNILIFMGIFILVCVLFFFWKRQKKLHKSL